MAETSGLFNELNTVRLATFLIAAVMFTFVSISDAKKGVIPNICVTVLYAVGLLNIVSGNMSLIDSAAGLCLGFGLFWILRKASSSVGGGDVKLMGAVGLFAGLRGTLFIIFFSFVSGAIVSILLMLWGIKSCKDTIPFGIFISAASMLYMAFGRQIICAYLSLITGGG